MGERLAHREALLEEIELAPAAEQDRQQLGGRHRPVDRVDDLAQAVGMVRSELVDAHVQPAERHDVRRQHQRLVGHEAAKALERGQVVVERVGGRLAAGQGDVRGDARQHLVARDQHAQIGAVERDMLGRMAGADDDPPFVPADGERVPVGEAMERMRRLDRDPGVGVAARLHLLGERGIEPVGAVEVGLEAGVAGVVVEHEHLVHQPLGAADP